MKRDMALCRLLLLTIEDHYNDSARGNLEVEGYDMATIAYHCGLLYDAGLIKSFNSKNADNHIYWFSVGALTWEGHNFIDNIREDTIWNATKNTIKERTLPMTLEVIKDISSTIISALVTGTIAGI